MKNIMKEMESLGKMLDFCATNNKAKEIKIDFKGHKMIMDLRRYERKDNEWVETGKEEREITERFYENIINSKHFFTNLGGIEKHTKYNTCIGYIVTSVISISPDGENKTIRRFTVI